MVNRNVIAIPILVLIAVAASVGGYQYYLNANANVLNNTQATDHSQGANNANGSNNSQSTTSTVIGTQNNFFARDTSQDKPNNSQDSVIQPDQQIKPNNTSNIDNAQKTESNQMQASEVKISSQATFIGPSSYQAFARDSPFAKLKPDSPYFFLETFEDKTVDTKGLTIDHGRALFGQEHVGGTYPADSVDEDDGLMDGNGNKGVSWAADSKTLTISFDKTALGNYPNYAGLVFTDSWGKPSTITYIAYGEDGAPISSIGPMTLGDSTTTYGETAEDKFIGFSYQGGIKALQIQSDNPYFEIDHAQYGWHTPNV